MAEILPSIFGANILRLQDEIDFLESENTGILHVDMMDGNFVSNIAFGPNQIAVQFAQQGANTVIVDYNIETGEQTAAEITRDYVKSLFVQADVSSPQQ